jgi:excisionase family DNA binding protein
VPRVNGTKKPDPDAVYQVWQGSALAEPNVRWRRVSVQTVRRKVDRGELRARHVGRQLRIDPADFRTYLDRDASA